MAVSGYSSEKLLKSGLRMGRVGWLRLCKRQLQATFAIGFLSVEQSRVPAMFHRRTVHGYNVHHWKPSDIATMGTPSTMRHIHATGVCYSTERNYYEILGVPSNASRETIKKAFHVLAKKFHPDANKNNPYAKRKFQEIRDAYETLQDSEKRAKYDRDCTMRSESVNDAAGEGFRYAYRSHFSDSFRKIFAEIFEHETKDFATDIQVELSLSFSEAAKGCTKNISFDAYVPCDSCYGHGHPVDAKTKVCPVCKGRGRVTIPPFTSTCSCCKGLGRIVKEYCTTCSGSGVVEVVKHAEVTIPAGVESGDTIRVPKVGNSGGQGVEPGNLFIKLKVVKDRTFVRDGADVYVESNISFTQAILGGTVDVPTLSGKTQVKIPKGVQHGQLLVLRGQGLPKHGLFVDHGDQYVRFRINFPMVINERQQAILEEFAKEEIFQDSSTSGEGNWWQQIFERGTTTRFLLGMSLFLLILQLLGKSVS